MDFGGLSLTKSGIEGPEGSAPLLGASAELSVVGGKRKLSGKRAVLLGPVTALAMAKKQGGALTLLIRSSGLNADIAVPAGKEPEAEAFANAINVAAERARSASREGETAEKSAAKDREREEKEQRKAEGDRARVAERTAREESRAAQAEAAGALVQSAAFAGKTVKIYENGFVQVAGLLHRADTPYERLLSIEASADVGKKSAAGRGAAALMTGGLNLLGSKQRGDVYLTIATSNKTHVLHQDPPTVQGMKASKALEGAGRAVLDRLVGSTSPSVDSSVPVSGGASVAERLRELTSMRDQGLVSTEEFDQLRSRLLDSL